MFYHPNDPTIRTCIRVPALVAEDSPHLTSTIHRSLGNAGFSSGASAAQDAGWTGGQGSEGPPMFIIYSTGLELPLPLTQARLTLVQSLGVQCLGTASSHKSSSVLGYKEKP